MATSIHHCSLTIVVSSFLVFFYHMKMHFLKPAGLVGVGTSDKPLARYSTSEMARDILDLLDHVNWTEKRQLHVIGVSMGGKNSPSNNCFLLGNIKINLEHASLFSPPAPRNDFPRTVRNLPLCVLSPRNRFPGSAK